MTKWDKALIVAIIIISLLLIGWIIYNKNQANSLYGIIEVNGEVQEEINLLEIEKPFTIKVENGEDYNIVQVEQGGIRIIEATCPDKDCIKVGTLDAPGEVSACLPNKVTVRVIGTNNDDKMIDGASY